MNCSLSTIAQQRLELPSAPLISSEGAGWDNIQLALFEQPAHYIPTHVSPCHVICINAGIEVTLEQTIESHRFVEDSVTGDIGIYPAQLLQSFQWNSTAKFLQLYVEPDYLDQLGATLYEKDEIVLAPQSVPSDPVIQSIAIALKDSLITSSETPSPIGGKLYADTLANALSTHLVYRYAADKPIQRAHTGKLSHRQLKRVKSYIEEHLAEDISLADLAGLVQLSPFHFSRLFKCSTGYAPHQYHIRCRIRQAKRLLQEKNLPIAQVAQTVGFSSQSHLNYHFKRVVGITPTAYIRG